MLECLATGDRVAFTTDENGDASVGIPPCDNIVVFDSLGVAVYMNTAGIKALPLTGARREIGAEALLTGGLLIAGISGAGVALVLRRRPRAA